MNRKAIAQLLLASLLLCWLAPSATAESAEAFCERFLETFVKRDFENLRGFFAPGATVAAIWLAEDPEPETKAAAEWTRTTEEATRGLEWLSFDIAERSTVSSRHGTVVSLAFRSRGRMGERTFGNDGIDTYVLASNEDGWKILHYTYIEKLEIDSD